ncbi:MAG: LEA type 2 family protein [Pseudomonadaceae bacterium]|jgi:LEA14-like dessication related protein|nr:LEA type 2 family protein [Pseudomonadaceae bacterium]
MFAQALITKALCALLSLALLLGISGCSSGLTDDLQDPIVRLLKVDVVKAKLLEQKFVLRFRIDNPNDLSLPVRFLRYKVKLNGVPLAEGESDRDFVIPANGHQNFEIPVRTNLWRHLKQIVSLLEDPNKPISYQLQGEVKTGLMFGRSVHLERKGEIIPGNYIPE